MAKDYFQLANLLKVHLAQEKSCMALARAINASNGLGEKARALVDRRKLKQIIDVEEDLVLSLRELRAIDRYLQQFNQGLAKQPLFLQPESVVEKLVKTDSMTFLLGAKPEATDFRVSFSHWDVMAMAAVQHEAYQHSSSIHFAVLDVLLHDNFAAARKAGQRGPWIGHFDGHGPALVCLGSTRALHATEVMLARMFGVQPFDPGECERMPFHFVWPKDLDHVFPSSFHLSLPTEGARTRALEVRPPGGKSEILADTFTRHADGETYGILVAQRRRNDKLWICLAGVTGLGTLAAARALNNMVVSFAPDQGARNSPVFWRPVRAKVFVHPNNPPGRVYELGPLELLWDEPCRWPA